MADPLPDSPAEYVSVPVVITAAQWDGTEEHAQELCAWADFYRGRGSTCYIPARPPVEYNGEIIEHPAHIVIGTLEGHMKLHQGAWLIKGTENEFYPCKDSVFKAKYRKGSAPGKLPEHRDPFEIWGEDAAAEITAERRV